MHSKSIKLHNLLLPIWLLIFFPPLVFGVLLGNFIIDSIVMIICYCIFKKTIGIGLIDYYKKTIIKVWLFGFLADIIGALILLLIVFLSENLPRVVYEVVAVDPFIHPIGIVIFGTSISISSILIAYLNNKYVLSKFICEKKTRIKISIIIAIVTAPWTFLLPMDMSYQLLEYIF